LPGLYSSRLRGTRFARILFTLLAIAIAPAGFSGTPQLTRDINALLPAVDSDPLPLGAVGNTVYFSTLVDRSSGSRALYRTDGTAAGTVLLKTFTGSGPTVLSGVPVFVAAGNKAYFIADEGLPGLDVWVSDGTAEGTHFVQDFAPTSLGRPQLVGVLGTDLVFAISQGYANWQIFRTDGTAAGTIQLSDFNNVPYGTVDLSVSAGGKIFMQITQSNSCCNPKLWVSDGSARGLRPVVEDQAHPEDVFVYDMQVLGNSLLLNAATPAHGAEIARLDIATEALTFLEATVDPASGTRGGKLVLIKGVAYYTGLDATNPNSTYLWRTDGTLAGTSRVIDLNPGQISVVRAETLTKVGDRVVFVAEQIYQDPELWGSDGTAAGTKKLTSSVTAIPQIMGVAGSRAYFIAGLDPSPSPLKFLSTDGTPSGTKVIQGVSDFSYTDQFPLSIIGDDTVTFFSGPAYDASRNQNVLGMFRYDPQTSQATFLATQDEMLTVKQPVVFTGERAYFKAWDVATGYEPWSSDGTVAGTSLVKNIRPEVLTSDSTPDWLTEFNGKLYFVADDGVHGREIWMSDGSEAGTKLAFDVWPGADSSDPKQLFVWKGSLYFIARSAADNAGLMRTTGADAPLQTLASPLLAAPQPGDLDFSNSNCFRTNPVELNGKFYFAATDDKGMELWSTDGTAAGTARVADIVPGSQGSIPCTLTVYKNRIYFGVWDPSTFSSVMYSSDGTTAGTTPLFGGNVTGLPSLVYKDELYFVGTVQGQGGTWKTDGTAAGTRLLMEGQPVSLTPFGISNDRLVAYRSVPTSPTDGYYEIWTSDGTAAGTTKLDVRVLRTAPFLMTPNRLYFSNRVDTDSNEPWVSDGTAAGTVKLVDINPSGGSSPAWYVNFGGVVYFAATDPVRGPGIWRTNGTPSGTSYVGDIGAPVPNHLHNSATLVGQAIFFPGTFTTAGTELGVLRNDPPVAANDSMSAIAGTATTIGVATNDTDSDGTVDSSSVHIVSAPSHGTASVGPSGVSYTADISYSGTDSLTYTVMDNQGAVSNTGTVTVTVTAAATPPASGGGKKGGGGATSVWDLLALAMVLLGALARRATGRIEAVELARTG
jgi:ELWxxDGT repeat protein